MLQPEPVGEPAPEGPGALHAVLRFPCLWVGETGAICRAKAPRKIHEGWWQVGAQLDLLPAVWPWAAGQGLLQPLVAALCLCSAGACAAPLRDGICKSQPNHAVAMETRDFVPVATSRGFPTSQASSREQAPASPPLGASSCPALLSAPRAVPPGAAQAVCGGCGHGLTPRRTPMQEAGTWIWGLLWFSFSTAGSVQLSTRLLQF